MRTGKSKKNLIWVDMEMTGLDPEKERIIEIATIVTDGQLNILAEGPNLVIHQPDRVLLAMDKWNRKHHRKSGLIQAVRSSKTTVKEAEKRTLEFLNRFCHQGKSPLCGNSVHHDRKFLARYMPRLDAFLHYRHVDVSTIKEVVTRWYGKPKKFKKKKDSHRALSDIRESIGELNFYRQEFFKPLI